MLVFDEGNKYTFPNAVINFYDTTTWTEQADVPLPIPRNNVLIPIHVERGKVNTMMLYKTGQAETFLRDFGNPDCVKNGFGADLVHDILNLTTDDSIGVWVCNVRDESARAANTMLLMKYRVEAGVEVTNSKGEALYVTPAGDVTTSPITTTQTASGVVTTDNTRLTRDVLHVKYEAKNVNDISKWMESNKVMAKYYNVTTTDAEGYYTIPLFMVVHSATSTYGNSCYFRMTPQVSESDGKMYYAINLFDGQNTYNTEPIFSLSPEGGKLIGENYYIEEEFNTQFAGLMRMNTSPYMEDAMAMLNEYMAVDEVTFDDIDIFNPIASDGESVSTGYVVDPGSLDVTASKAFKLGGGSNGDPGADDPNKLFAKFFRGEIVKDIASVIRWRISYIPDVGYDDETIKAIKDLCVKRTRMTVATIMLGGATFDAAISDHNQKHINNAPTIRQICALQHAMRYNPFKRRTVEYPASYFDTLAFIRRILQVGNAYSGFAGYNARWTDFLEETMTFMPEDAQLMNRLDKARINVLMKDASDGGYLSDQKMNTKLISDQTEFNNAMLISDMLYDLIDLIHRNSFNFNEPDDVDSMQSMIASSINTTYAPYAASLSATVSKLGTRGKDKYTTKIVVTVNLKDINKYAVVDFILTDE